MKKIFTLLFFADFLTSAFAQQDRRQQYGNRTNDYRNQSSGNAGHNYAYSKPYNDHKGYEKNYQWDKRNNQNDNGYNKNRDRKDREDIGRNQYSNPECVTQKRIEDDSYRARPRAPLIKILFNISGIFQ
jgi:hypothetical protein